MKSFWHFAGGLVILMSATNLEAQQASLKLALTPRAEQSDFQNVRLVTPAQGHLFLLHIANGNVRVMFPGKPSRSPALPEGEYDLKLLDAELPYRYEMGGIILALWSDAPIRTDEFVRHGHWAVNDLSREAFKRNPQAESIALARRLGASPQLLAAEVKYNLDSYEARSGDASARGGYARLANDSLSWRVLNNFLRIQGMCPSGSRDVTGAGEYCTVTRVVARPGRSKPAGVPLVESPASRPVHQPPPMNAPRPEAQPAAREAPSQPAAPTKRPL